MLNSNTTKNSFSSKISLESYIIKLLLLFSQYQSNTIISSNKFMQIPTFQHLQQIINKPLQQFLQLPFTSPFHSSNNNNHFVLAITYIVNKQLKQFIQISKQFTLYLSQQKQINIHHQFLIDNFHDIKFMVCKQIKTPYTSQPTTPQSRGYVIFGKVVSIYKNPKHDQQPQHKQQRDQFSQLIQEGITSLVQNGKYILPKQQKSQNLNDILLHHDLPDLTLQQAYTGNEVYSPFVPLQKSIIMYLPSKLSKPSCYNFILSSLLHTFISQTNLMNKIMTREQFFRGLVIKGIYFIQEGQVQVKSGRTIVRGWTTHGKCKIIGFGWKFKPIPFIRVLIRNPPIWKQFYNDIKLNGEHPFNIANILTLANSQNLSLDIFWNLHNKKKLLQRLRSPKYQKFNIKKNVIQEIKFQEIDKMKHYDDRFKDVYLYKQNLLTRKLKGSINFLHFQPIFKTQASQHSIKSRKKQCIKLHNRSMQLSPNPPNPQSSQKQKNIYIMTLLKKLSNLDIIKQNKQKNISNQIIIHQLKQSNIKLSAISLRKKCKAEKKNKKFF